MITKYILSNIDNVLSLNDNCNEIVDCNFTFLRTEDCSECRKNFRNIGTI